MDTRARIHVGERGHRDTYIALSHLRTMRWSTHSRRRDIDRQTDGYRGGLFRGSPKTSGFPLDAPQLVGAMPPVGSQVSQEIWGLA
jgi:hypothetical protein